MIENEGATAEVEALPVEVEVEQPEKSMDDTIRETLRGLQEKGVTPDVTDATPEDDVEKAARIRDEKGKFAKKEATPEAAPTDQFIEPVIEAKKAPSSWRKEAQEKFAALPPDIQDEVLKREQDFHKGTEAYKEYATKGQEYERTLSPYMATINGFGATPQQAIQELFSSDHTLRYGTPDQKIGMVHRIFKDYGISPQSVFESLQNQPQVDPNVAALQQQLGQLQSQQQQWLQSQQQSESAALNSELANFAQGKEHFESVRVPMAALLQNGIAKDLQEAYDMAIYANPTTRAVEIAKQQTAAREEARKKAEAAKASASVNVTRRPSLPASQPIGSMDDTIRSTLRRLQGS